MTKEYLFNLEDYSQATWGQSESEKKKPRSGC